MSSNVSFTSYIKPVTTSDFGRITASFGKRNLVDFPWTMAESALGENVVTTRINDCTACLITDGEKALLMHLCPEFKANRKFNDLLNFMNTNINLMVKDRTQAIMIGSKDTVESQSIWNNFSTILKMFEIPITKLKNGKGETNIAYKRSSDEVLISSNLLDKDIIKGKKSSMEILNSHFQETLISWCDEVI